MSGLLIRHAHEADYAHIDAVTAAAYAQYENAVPAAVFAAYVADLGLTPHQAHESEILLCEMEGRIVGSVLYYPNAALEGLGLPSTWAGFRKLAVDPRSRGRGVGRALVARCLELARASEAVALGIHTASFMEAACRLYEDLGFHRRPEHDLSAAEILGSADGAEGVKVIAYVTELSRPPRA